MASMASRAWVEVFFITRNPIKRGRTMAGVPRAGQVEGGRIKMSFVEDGIWDMGDREVEAEDYGLEGVSKD